MVRTIACKVAVISRERILLSALRSSCEQFAFVEEADADGVRIVIIDGDAATVDIPRHVIVRIILDDEGPAPPRRFGELRLGRREFAADPSRYLTFAADMVATVEHARTIEREFEFFDEIRDLIATSNFDVVFEKVTRTLLRLLQLDHAVLLLHDPRIERYAPAFGTDPLFRDDGQFLPGVRPELLQESLQGERGYAVMPASGERSGLMIFPLQFEEDLIGVVRVRFGGDELLDALRTERACRYLRTVTPIVGNVYQLTRSKELAMRDDLTKAFNRRFFESYLDEEIERARRYGSLFSVIFLDLDDLKLVNNRYGHLIGSRTLQEVAKRILSAVRTIDKVVRFGGDEFCILLPQTDQAQARSVAERVRNAMSDAPFAPEAGIEVSITASFGIATYPVHAHHKEGLIRAADSAMYRVKSTTKNSIGIADPIEITPAAREETA